VIHPLPVAGNNNFLPIPQKVSREDVATLNEAVTLASHAIAAIIKTRRHAQALLDTALSLLLLSMQNRI
jgi:hypothetical protein